MNDFYIPRGERREIAWQYAIRTHIILCATFFISRLESTTPSRRLSPRSSLHAESYFAMSFSPAFGCRFSAARIFNAADARSRFYLLFATIQFFQVRPTVYVDDADKDFRAAKEGMS